MDKLFTLLALHRRAQEAGDLGALSHVIVNETLQIISYKQAVFWTGRGASIDLKAVSGNAALDEKSSYALSLKKLIKKHEGTAESIIFITPEKTKDEEDWLKNPAALLIFKTPAEGIVGGLWLEREEPFQKAEEAILSELAISYAHALATTKLRENALLPLVWQKIKTKKLYVLGAIALALLFPVRLSITAPAEIIAQDPFVISAPFDATLESITVQPGDKVEEGQIIAEMDKISLDAQNSSLQQEVEVARRNLSRLSRESLSSPEKKIELKKLEAEIAAKEIEFEYAQTMLGRSDIKSPVSGIAIFADKNAMQGKPIAMGEKIMVIADPKDSELLIRVPVDAMIPLNNKVKSKFFLNVSPLKSHKAEIHSIGYQASPDADGLLTYKLRAKLSDKDKEVRIGWKGTAKVYGQRTILAYALLRRPLASFRELTGL